MSRTHSEGPRSGARRGGPGALVAVVVLLGALGAAAWWMGGGAGSDGAAELSRTGSADATRGMTLAVPERGESESLEEAVTAPARAAAEAQQRAAATAEVEWRGGALEGRIVSLDGGAPPDGLSVHLRWTRPSPRLRTVTLGTAREATFPDEAEVFASGDNSPASLRARDARLALVTRAKVAADGGFRIERVPRMACWLQVEHDTWWAPEPPRVAGLPKDTADAPPLAPVDVGVTQGSAVRGVVHDGGGAPIGGCRLSIQVPLDPFTFLDGGGQELRVDPVWSADDGGFVLGPLPSGLAMRLDAEATGDRQGTSHGVPPLAPGEVRAVDVLLRPGAGVSGVVRDADGTPVQDATVRLMATDVSAMSIGADGRPPDIERRSDAAGAFDFRGVVPGGWRLVVAALDRKPLVGEPFELEAGQRVDGLELVVERGMSVAGRVLDARGEPVEDAQVMASRAPSMIDVQANLDRTYRTWKDVEADGTFELHGYAPGGLRVRARAPGHVATYADADAGDDDLLLELGDTTSISGIAMDLETGEPLTEYTLAAYAGDGSFSMADMFELQERLEASRAPVRVRHEEGRFQLDGLQPGPYSLVLTAEGHARVVRSGIVAQADKATTGVILMVPLEGRLTGRVVDGRTGEPLANATVTTGATDMLSTYRELFAGASPRATTDADGRFVLGGLDDRPVTVSVKHEGHVDETLPEVAVRSGDTYDVGLVRLLGGARLYGRILDALGVPKEGVLVISSDATGRTLRRGRTDDDGRWEITGLPPGSYRVNRMDITLDLGAFDAGDYMEEMVVRTVTVAAGDEIEVDLGRGESSGTTLRGTITSSDGPQAGAMVVAIRQEGEADVRFATADDDGVYELRGLRPGETLLQVMPDAEALTAGSQPSAPVTDVVDVKDVAVQTHDLRVPGGLLALRLVDEDGHGVDGVRVILERTDAGRTSSRLLAATGHRVGEIISRDGGQADFAHLPTGTYDLAIGGRNLLGVGDPGWAFQRVEGNTVTDGKPASTVRVTLRPGAGIEGLVSDARGKPIAGAPVWVRDERQGRWLSVLSETSSDHAGVFHVDGLEPGPYSLAVGGTSHAFTRVPTVAVSRGHVAHVGVELPDGVEVFVDPGPYTLRELQAEVRDAFGRLPLELASMDSILGTLAAGRMRVGRVAPGPYDLTIVVGGQVVRSGPLSVGLGDDPLTITLEAP